MANVKTFQIEGEIRKPNAVLPFSKLVRALDQKQASERIYTLFGSRHKAKRSQIRIFKIEEKVEAA